jgi:hypothetical protein
VGAVTQLDNGTYRPSGGLLSRKGLPRIDARGCLCKCSSLILSIDEHDSACARTIHTLTVRVFKPFWSPTTHSITVPPTHSPSQDTPSTNSPAAKTTSAHSPSPPSPPAPVPPPTSTSDSTAPIPTWRIYAAPLASNTLAFETFIFTLHSIPQSCFSMMLMVMVLDELTLGTFSSPTISAVTNTVT